MRINILYAFLLALCIAACSIKKDTNIQIDLKTYCFNAYKQGQLERNPLIVIDGRAMGLLNAVNLDSLEIRSVRIKSLKTISSGSEYLSRFWGIHASKGIVQISKATTLYCGNQPKSILLIDDKGAEIEALELLDAAKICSWTHLNEVIDKDNNVFTVTMVTTKQFSYDCEW